MDDPCLKDLKQCLQNLFFKRDKKKRTCNFVCMYVKNCVDDMLHDGVLLFTLFLFEVVFSFFFFKCDKENPVEVTTERVETRSFLYFWRVFGAIFKQMIEPCRHVYIYK